MFIPLYSFQPFINSDIGVETVNMMQAIAGNKAASSIMTKLYLTLVIDLQFLILGMKSANA